MSVVTFSKIHKTYDPGLFKKKVKAVNDLSFDIREGEVFGLIGPNGAGKSTTIRMLLGLIRPDSGEIQFRDQPLGEVAIQREIGYLPENPYLYDHLNLIELLNFCGRASGLNRTQVEQRGRDLMAKLNLTEARKRPLRTFSKGMLQRAGICFALLHDPAMVILDEPMSGLDPVGRKMVFDLVMELKQAGKTIFFCSHILNDVERLCDRIGLMHRGQLVRQFEQLEFRQNAADTVFLKVAALDDDHRQQLQSLGCSIRPENGGELLSVPGDRFYAINEYLSGAAVAIRGCRSEWVSLEDLFMQVVKEREA